MTVPFPVIFLGFLALGLTVVSLVYRREVRSLLRHHLQISAVKQMRRLERTYDCPDCGRRVSLRAAVCPQCGAPLRKTTPY